MDPTVRPSSQPSESTRAEHGRGPDAVDAAPPPAPKRRGPGPVPPRRWTLRARLIALVVATAAVALAAVDIVLPLVVRDATIATKDATLQAANDRALQELNLTREVQNTLGDDSGLKGEVGWSTITVTGLTKVVVAPASDEDANPDLSDGQWLGVGATVGSAAKDDRRYRAMGIGGVSINGQPGYLVAWIPMADLDEQLRRLILAELLITAGLLVLLGATAGLVIRRELRPLESMASTADAIARGDLSRRVTESDPSTEIGRLGYAFNDMLDGISSLLDERRRGENKLRRFVADASHELRTPVAAVRGYTDLYQAGALPDESAVDRAMQRMGFESRRMGALVDDLLTLIQADAENAVGHDLVDLNELLAGVVDDAAVIDQTRTWRLAASNGGVDVLGDRLRLHQVFANLLSNIRTHTPEGTTATISVLPGLGEIAVSVSDNGPGVPDEDLDRLFDRFYRVDPSRSRERGGTGLGLSIVAAIVRGHGGRIVASHTPGGGLTISVVLPRASGTAAVRQAKNGVGDQPET
ncbi:MAG TPA: ATP-binding protein [Nakamurella sp.]|jgi:two-component system OmpR family sensor kinase